MREKSGMGAKNAVETAPAPGKTGGGLEKRIANL
jgi:hypothetical protein